MENGLVIGTATKSKEEEYMLSQCILYLYCCIRLWKWEKCDFRKCKEEYEYWFLYSNRLRAIVYQTRWTEYSSKIDWLKITNEWKLCANFYITVHVNIDLILLYPFISVFARINIYQFSHFGLFSKLYSCFFFFKLKKPYYCELNKNTEILLETIRSELNIWFVC